MANQQGERTMPPIIKTDKLFPIEQTLAVAGTAELMGAGPTESFDTQPTFLEIGYASLDCFIAETEAALGSAADGSLEGRIFIKSGTVGRIIPWGSRTVWFVNKTSEEKPALYVVGMV
jgi:hypothetical protein